ncbi:hypothetical protein FXO38_21906 [Capsicum annuum]|nr:hypothetical protein FXO38_21906 [Capsicum annuum]
MKKLKEAASSRLKKSSSTTTSKKKFDDSGRPGLSKIFEIFDPTSAASTSVAPTLKRSGDEDQLCIVTTDDDYDDFTTRPTQEFLRKDPLASSLSTEKASKRRKIVMFQEVSPTTTDGEKSTSAPSACHVSDKDKGPIIEIRNDEPSVLQPLKTEIQDCVHIHTECPTTTEVQSDKRPSNYQLIYDELMHDKEEAGLKYLKKEYNPVMDNLMPDKEEAGLEDLGKEHSPVMDEHIVEKEAGCAEELNIQHSLAVKDLQDDVDATIIESVQDAIDALLFGFSTPSDTKTSDVFTPNIVTESQ